MKDMKKKLSPIELKAKTGVLEQLKKDMQDMMGDKVAGLKKVTVASSDPKGLEAGLAKAKEMIHGGDEPDSFLPESADEESEETPDHESSESPEMESSEHGDISPESEEELDAKIQELLKKKASLKK